MGSTERRISRLFEKVQMNDPAVLLIDDIDSLLPCPDTEDSGMENTLDRTLSTFLTLLDGLDSRRDRWVAIVCTSTLTHSELPSALVRPGRLETWFHVNEFNALRSIV